MTEWRKRSLWAQSGWVSDGTSDTTVSSTSIDECNESGSFDRLSGLSDTRGPCGLKAGKLVMVTVMMPWRASLPGSVVSTLVLGCEEGIVYSY